jgi:predicted esterase
VKPPLVVVLHGDREHAKQAAARWRTAVKEKHWALLALECPKDEGCKDSWWKWDGDPQWVLDQIAATREKHTLARVFFIGWSGGATYLGWHSQAWAPEAAAIVFHGGGAAPSDQSCVTLPAYFLVGDKNPLHHLATGLREYFDTCKQEVVWDLVKGGNHAREAKALTAKKARAILDWLAAH